MKITSKGQVTIPLEMRERFGLQPQTEVEFAAGDSGLIIRPARTEKMRFEAWLEKARGSATVKTSTDEIMRLTRGVE